MSALVKLRLMRDISPVMVGAAEGAVVGDAEVVIPVDVLEDVVEALAVAVAGASVIADDVVGVTVD